MTNIHLKRFFGKKEKIIAGLDVGTSLLKVVKLRIGKDKTEVCAFATEPAKADLEECIKKISQSQEIKRVNIALSGPSVITRYTNFSRMNITELKQALKFEAQKYIPFPLAEINLDACILNPEAPDNKMFILISAVKKEYLNQRLKILQGAGLEVNIATIDSLALIDCFNFNYSGDESLKNKAVALVNIGSAFTNLNILENNVPHLSRNIVTGANNFSDKTDSVFSGLIQELRSSFDYYESQGALAVSKIFLSGGSCKFPQLKESLAKVFNIEVEYWDVFKKILPAEGVSLDKIKDSSSQFAVAVGLALRG